MPARPDRAVCATPRTTCHTMTWHHAADTADLAGRDVVGRLCGGRTIAIYRIDGAYFATAGLCTHGNAALADGEVVDGYIECPLHFGLFEIRTGRAAGAPVCVDLRTYPVRVVGTRIEVACPAEGSFEEDAG